MFCAEGFCRALLVLALTAEFASAEGDGAAQRAGSSNEVKLLQAQIAGLVDALAASRAEADSLRARMVRKEFARYASVSLRPAQLEAGDAAPPRILEVNGELRIVVLGRGARQGIRPGMRFAVLRADRVVGEIETVDVREKIAGAVVIGSENGVLPETGDRLAEIAGLKK